LAKRYIQIRTVLQLDLLPEHVSFLKLIKDVCDL